MPDGLLTTCVVSFMFITAVCLNYTLFFIRMLFFPAQAEYFYFSADFRLKIFFYYS